MIDAWRLPSGYTVGAGVFRRDQNQAVLEDNKVEPHLDSEPHPARGSDSHKPGVGCRLWREPLDLLSAGITDTFKSGFCVCPRLRHLHGVRAGRFWSFTKGGVATADCTPLPAGRESEPPTRAPAGRSKQVHSLAPASQAHIAGAATEASHSGNMGSRAAISPDQEEAAMALEPTG